MWICKGKRRELQSGSRKLIFVRWSIKIEAMGQNRDMKRRGQPQNVSLLLSFVYISLSLSLSRISLTYSNCVPCCYGYLCCRAQQRCSCSNEDIKRGLTLSSHSWLCQKTESWWDDEVISIFDKKLSLLLISLLWQTDVKIIFEKVFLANFLALIKLFFYLLNIFHNVV